MTEFRGIFSLRTPDDLLRKLKHDFERVSRDPEDQYAAFDFFVTAHHLPEWMFPNDEKRANDYRRGTPLLRLVRELGDVAKHYELTKRPATHAEVTSHIVSRYGLGPIGVGHYSAGCLLVHLTQEGQELIGPTVLDVRGLARQVLDHYTAELGEVAPRPRHRFDKSPG